MGHFKGISQEQSAGRRSFTFPTGFRAIVQEFADNTRFIRVTDFKGIPLSNVQVKVNNSAGSLTTTTSQDGIAEILPDAGGTVTIDLKQFSMDLVGVFYTTNSEPRTRSIVLDTIIPVL